MILLSQTVIWNDDLIENYALNIRMANTLKLYEKQDKYSSLG